MTNEDRIPRALRRVTGFACTFAIIAAVTSGCFIFLTAVWDDAVWDDLGPLKLLARCIFFPGALIAFGIVGDGAEFEVVARVSAIVVNTLLGAIAGAVIGWIRSNGDA